MLFILAPPLSSPNLKDAKHRLFRPCPVNNLPRPIERVVIAPSHFSVQRRNADVSQYETSIHFLAPLVLDYNVNGRVAGRMGNRCSYAAPHGAYLCQEEDRWCAIAVFDDEEWHNFCNVLGNPEWTRELRFSTILSRKQNEDELDN